MRAIFTDLFPGAFPPVLAKHSKSFSPSDCISVGVDRMQRNFEPMRKQGETWQRTELTDVTAKVVVYEAFVESKLTPDASALTTNGGRRQRKVGPRFPSTHRSRRRRSF